MSKVELRALTRKKAQIIHFRKKFQRFKVKHVPTLFKLYYSGKQYSFMGNIVSFS